MIEQTRDDATSTEPPDPMAMRGDVVALHLSDDDLAQYACGLSSCADDRRVELHVRRCSSCQSRLVAHARMSMQLFAAAECSASSSVTHVARVRGFVRGVVAHAVERLGIVRQGLVVQAAGVTAVVTLLVAPASGLHLHGTSMRAEHALDVVVAATCEPTEAEICEDNSASASTSTLTSELASDDLDALVVSMPALECTGDEHVWWEFDPEVDGVCSMIASEG